MLLARARSLLAEADRAVAEVRCVSRSEAGVLAIGYAPNAAFEVLPRLVPAYRERWPDVRLDLIELRSPDQPAALLVAAGMGLSVAFRPLTGVSTRLSLSVRCTATPSPRARALVDLAAQR